MAASLVNTSARGSWGGASLSTTATIASVSSGNTLIAIFAHQDFGNTNPTFTVSDAQGSYTQDAFVRINSVVGVGIYSLFAANSGSHTVTVTAQSGTSGNSFGALRLLEWSGLASVDKTITASNGTTTPATGSTAALTQTDDVIITVVGAQQTLAGGTFPPTGGPGTYTAIDSAPTSLFIDMDYQIIVSSSAAVSASWGTITTSTGWAAALATYKTGTSLVAQPDQIFAGVKRVFVNEFVNQN